jgi:hypothetical protein
MLLDNPPKNVDKFIVWYNPNHEYLKKYGVLSRMKSQDNIQFIPISGVSHAEMPQKVLPTILSDLQKNKSSQVASTNNKGDELNNTTKQNQNLKEGMKPVSYIDNSSKTKEIGKKSSPKILAAADKLDYPIHIKVQS